MGMPEFEDGSLGGIEKIKDFEEAQEKANADKVRLMHLSKDFKSLEEKKRVGAIEEKTFFDNLERIETMLGAIITHFKIPYKGILRVYKAKD